MKAQLAAYALRAVRHAERARWPHIEVRDVVVVALLLLSFLFTAHYVNSAQAAQERQGRITEHKICTTLGRLAARRPPAGDAAANPSRAYLQWQHDTLAELGPDLGCR